MNLIHSLRPFAVRIVKYGQDEKTDVWPWRVTVHLAKDGTIQDIVQECEVGIMGGYEHGHALYCEAKKRGIL